jgi:hypothetical protein
MLLSVANIYNCSYCFFSKIWLHFNLPTFKSPEKQYKAFLKRWNRSSTLDRLVYGTKKKDIDKYFQVEQAVGAALLAWSHHHRGLKLENGSWFLRDGRMLIVHWWIGQPKDKFCEFGEGPKMATRGGWMGANQNSSMEFDLCPKINPKPLSSNPIKTS